MTGHMSLRQHEEDRFAIDRQTADRLLRGALAPEDSPPEYREVCRTVRNLVRATTPAEFSGRAATVDAIAAEVSAAQQERRAGVAAPPRRTAVRSINAVAATVVVAALSATTGLTMAGALPDSAQRFVASALAKVGVSAPTPTAPSHSRPRSVNRPSSGTRSVGQSNDSSRIGEPTMSTAPDTPVSGPAGGVAPGAPGGGANPGPPPPSGPGRSDQHGTPPGPLGPGKGSKPGRNGNGNAGGNGNGASHANSPKGVAGGHP